MQRLRQKLAIPTPTRTAPLLVRTESLSALRQAIIEHPLTVIAAPAGWGKTTMALQCVTEVSLPVAWYTLNAYDRDPRIFLGYVLEAIAAIVPDVTDLTAEVEHMPVQHLKELFQATLHTLADITAPVVLVLDDAHTLEQEHALPGTTHIFELLNQLPEYAPNLHIVLISRTIPNFLELMRLGLHRQASVFDITTLRWNHHEVQQLAILHHQKMDDAAAEQLVTTLDGWPAAIALSLDQGIQVPYHTPQDRVYALLAEQVIAPLPNELRQFLFDTSVLEVLTITDCNTVCAIDNAAWFLDELIRRRLFVVQREQALVYHDLFRTFLREQLARNPQRYHNVLCRAAQLYQERDQIEQALRCYLDAREKDHAVVLLEERGPRLRYQGQHSTLLACFELLQEHNCLTDALLLLQARAYGNLEHWDNALTIIQGLIPNSNKEIQWQAQIIASETCLVKHKLGQANEHLKDIPINSLSPYLKSLYYRALGRLHSQSSDQAKAIAALEQAVLYRKDDITSVNYGSVQEIGDIHDNLGYVFAKGGYYHEAIEQLQQADYHWQILNATIYRSVTLNNLGAIALKQGLYDQARQYIERGLKLEQRYKRQRVMALLYISLGQLEFIESNTSLAQTYFVKTFKMVRKYHLKLLISIVVLEIIWINILDNSKQDIEISIDDIDMTHLSLDLDYYTRYLMLQAHLLLVNPESDFTTAADQLQKTKENAIHITPPYRAYLALLEVVSAVKQKHMNEALTTWEYFQQQAQDLPESLTSRFLALHPEAVATLTKLEEQTKTDTTIAPTLDERYDITALGSFVFQRNGTSTTISAFQQVLITRLLEAGPHGIAVEQMWEEVWNNEQELNPSAIWQILYRLRERSGLTISMQHGICAITRWEGITYDVQGFKELVKQEPTQDIIEQAEVLYRGDFLAGNTTNLWVDRHRTRLREDYLQLLIAYAESQATDQPDQALRYYQQVVERDPYREDIAVQIITLAAQLGHHSLARTTYTQLTQALRTLEMEPDPETIALYHRVAGNGKAT
ncbi:MAG: BTAD domain-containing putative transcriptional regulator [Chloroflexota bacterium]